MIFAQIHQIARMGISPFYHIRCMETCLLSEVNVNWFRGIAREVNGTRYIRSILTL